MPALSNIVLMDGEATPVSHTFKPMGSTQKGLTQFAEADANGIPALSNRLDIDVRRIQTSGAFRRELKLQLPVIDQDANGNDIVVDTNIITMNARLSKYSSTQNRKNLRVLAHNLLDEALTASLMDDVEAIL